MTADAYYMAFLPRTNWRSCSFCDGSGERVVAEDCHQSEGVAPCWICGGSGSERYDKVSPEEYNRRGMAGELADSRGVLQPPWPKFYWSAPSVREVTTRPESPAPRSSPTSMDPQ